MIRGGSLQPVDAVLHHIASEDSEEQGRAEERFYIPSDPPQDTSLSGMIRMGVAFRRDMIALFIGSSGEWVQTVLASIGSLTDAGHDAIQACITRPTLQSMFSQIRANAQQAAGNPEAAIYVASEAALKKMLQDIRAH